MTYWPEGNNSVQEKRRESFLMANDEMIGTEGYSRRSYSVRTVFLWHLEKTATCSWASNVALRQIHYVMVYTAEMLFVAPTETSICVGYTGQRLPWTRLHHCLHHQHCPCHGSAT